MNWFVFQIFESMVEISASYIQILQIETKKPQKLLDCQTGDIPWFCDFMFLWLYQMEYCRNTQLETATFT